MPTIFIFKDKMQKNRDTIILRKEQSVDSATPDKELLEMLKVRLTNIVKFEEDYTTEEISTIVEDTIEEYGGTLIPYTAYVMEYWYRLI